MKKILFLVLILSVSTIAWTQKNFEGLIKYDVKILEKQFAMFASMMPNEYEFYIKGQDILYRVNGGITATFLGDFLSKGKEGKTYMINRNQKTIYTLDEQSQLRDKSTKITATKETKSILGYNCKKYIMELKADDGSIIEQTLWVTSDIQFTKPKSNESVSGISNSFFIDGIHGFPLQVTSSTVTNGMRVTIDMIAKKVEPKTLDATIFELPKDFKIEKFKNPFLSDAAPQK